VSRNPCSVMLARRRPPATGLSVASNRNWLVSHRGAPSSRRPQWHCEVAAGGSHPPGLLAWFGLPPLGDEAWPSTSPQD
jgi:hypothetical protein